MFFRKEFLILILVSIIIKAHGFGNLLKSSQPAAIPNPAAAIPNPADAIPNPSAAIPNPTAAVQQLQQLAGGGGASAGPSSCSISGASVTCCADIGLPVVNIMKTKTCVKLDFDISSLKVHGSLIFNGVTLLKRDLTAGLTDMCQPLPLPMPANLLKACLDIYRFDVKPTAMTAEVCAAVSVSRLIRIQFDCIKFSKGMISIEKAAGPDKASLLNVAMDKGKPNFSLGIPSVSSMIPKPSLPSFLPKLPF